MYLLKTYNHGSSDILTLEKNACLLMVHLKGSGCLRVGFLSCNATYCMWQVVSNLALFIASCGN